MANEQNLIRFTPDTAAVVGARGGHAKKGKKHINTWVQELMHDDDFTAWVTDPKEGVKEFKGAPIQAIIKAQMIKAINGDTKAYDSLVKSGWVQKIETDITTKGEAINGTIDPAQAAGYAEYLKGK